MIPFHPLQVREVITRASHALTPERPVTLVEQIGPPEEGSLVAEADTGDHLFPQRCMVDARREIPAHKHEHCEILFILGGKAVHHTAYFNAPLRRGDVVFTVPGQVHQITHLVGLHRVACDFLPEWLARDGDDLSSEPALLPLLMAQGGKRDPSLIWIPHETLDARTFDRSLAELQDIGAELERDTPSLPYIRHSLLKLLLMLGHAFSESPERVRHHILREEVIAILQGIERIIESREPFHMRLLVEETGLSETCITRLLREVTGLSPMHYYQHRRIQHACWYLLHTDESITEIALALGFTDTPHFIRHFHKIRGESPGTYRTRHQGSQDR